MLGGMTIRIVEVSKRHCVEAMLGKHFLFASSRPLLVCILALLVNILKLGENFDTEVARIIDIEV